MSELGDKLTRAIRGGKVDDDLESLYAAIAQRHKAIRQHRGRQVLEQLRVGSRVQVTGDIKPKYLQGAVGVVMDMTPRMRRGSRMVEVKFDEVHGRFSGGGIPVTCLTILEA